MRIRAYSEADYDVCRELWVELTDHHRKIYESTKIGGDDPGAGLDEFLAHPAFAAAWVAEGPDHRVIGLTGLLERGAEGEIEPVVVHAASRGEGVGRTLIERVIQEARERRLTSLKIRPVARNATAIATFAKLGFRTLGHIELFQSLDPVQGPDAWRPGITIHGVALDH